MRDGSRPQHNSAQRPVLKFQIPLSHSGFVSRSDFHCSNDFLYSSTLKPSSPGTEHLGSVSPRSVLAAGALWLVSRRKRSKSESSIVSPWCLWPLGPAGPNPTSWRCICCRSRLHSVQSFLQHLTSVPVGLKELSCLFGSFFALPHSFALFHHLLDQGRNLLFHNFGLTTQTNQESTTRSSAQVLSGTPNFFGHDEFS